jgi:flagellar basal body rod protein FlgG
MNIGLYQSAASLTALERWQDTVAQNVTAAQTPGFRKRTVEFTAIEMGQMQAETKGGATDSTRPALFPTTSMGVSFKPGEAAPTSRPLDVAIDGDGFFEVQMPDGSRGYTRAGAFHLNTQRMVVTGDDLPVLNKAGNPIVLQPEGGDLSIAQDGALSQGDTQLGNLSVVTFSDNSKLAPVGGGTFLLKDDSMEPVQAAQPAVRQGYIEGSNVEPLREMISLVQIARAYEANQKIISNRDQNIGKALETLG